MKQSLMCVCRLVLQGKLKTVLRWATEKIKVICCHYTIELMTVLVVQHSWICYVRNILHQVSRYISPTNLKEQGSPVVVYYNLPVRFRIVQTLQVVMLAIDRKFYCAIQPITYGSEVQLLLYVICLANTVEPQNQFCALASNPYLL